MTSFNSTGKTNASKKYAEKFKNSIVILIERKSFAIAPLP